MNNKTIICPVSTERINENVTKVAAFLTLVVATASVLFKQPALFIALGFDFALRAFTNGTYSPIRYLSKRLSIFLNLDVKLTDAAPKKFAAGLGLVFSIVISVLQLTQYINLANITAGMLVACASLEAFAGYCIGCVMYTYLVSPFMTAINRNN
jgi:hypothetical protein